VPSGGPIVAADGRVIGLVVEDSAETASFGVGAISSGPEGFPFFRGIPSSEVNHALEHFKLAELLTFEDA